MLRRDPQTPDPSSTYWLPLGDHTAPVFVTLFFVTMFVLIGVIYGY